MPRRGGLGRGLDSLIPDRVGKRSKEKEQGQTPEKPGREEKLKETKKKSPAEGEKKTAERVLVETKTSSDGSGEKNAAETQHTDSNVHLKSDVLMDTLTESEQEPKESVIDIRLSEVEPNRNQPRQFFDDDSIDELADSISKYGVISPLLVQKRDNYYEIIAGERRWRAAKKAGLKKVPVIIKNISGQEAVEISLIENLQREDLNPIEEAQAYERLVREFGLKQEEVASRVSKSRSAVTNSMRLLKLQPDVQKMVEQGQISEGHARTIVSLDDPELQTEVAKEIVEQQLSVRQTEMLVKELQQPVEKKKAKPKPDLQRSALFDELANNLKGKLGTKVNIKPSGKSKGRIEIEYYSDEDLDRIYDLLQSVHQ